MREVACLWEIVLEIMQRLCIEKGGGRNHLGHVADCLSDLRNICTQVLFNADESSLLWCCNCCFLLDPIRIVMLRVLGRQDSLFPWD